MPSKILSLLYEVRRCFRGQAQNRRAFWTVCLIYWTVFSCVVPPKALLATPPVVPGYDNCGSGGNSGTSPGNSPLYNSPDQSSCGCQDDEYETPGETDDDPVEPDGSKCGFPIEQPAVTKDPINLRYGIAVEKVTDLVLPAAAMDWSLVRSFSGSMPSGAERVGNKWFANVGMRQVQNPNSTISFCSDGSTSRTFTPVSGGFTGPKDSTLQLGSDLTNHLLILTNKQSNMRWTFFDFSSSNAFAIQGKLKEQTTLQLYAQGLSGNTYSYDSNGRLTQITTSAGQDYSISFTYGSSYMSQVQVKDASNNLLQQVDYTYYQGVTSPSTDLGTTNDLVQVKVSKKATNDTAGTLSIVRYTQYRYTSGSRLKAVYEHDDVQRMVSTLGLSTPESILSLADAYGTPKVNTFASRSFTYYTATVNTASVNTPFAMGEDLNTTYGGTDISELNQVATETIGGCGSCSTTGSITKSYFYLGIGNGSTNHNVGSRLIVEDTQDSAGNPIYRNVMTLETTGRKLRHVFIQSPTSSPKYWCESWILDPSATVPNFILTEHRYPSAHTGVTTAANLRSFLYPFNGSSWSNDTSTVNSSSGLIEVHEYDSNVMRSGTRVKNGSSGTSYYVSAWDYGDSTNTSIVTASYDYPAKTTTRSSGNQTSYSYTFYDSSTHYQIKTKTTTLPAVPTTQNGSNVATATNEYYDNRGRLRWTQDGEGYINYYSYNPTTGKVAYAAIDVDPASPGSDIFSGSSGNWEAVSVGGASSNQPTRSGSLPTPLALATKKYFDPHGWKRRVSDAAGADHYVVYSNTQTIRFPYWNGGSNQCRIPALVNSFNSAGQVTDRIAVKASYSAIATSSSAPTGFSTAPGQSDYVRWTHNTYDAVGRLSYVDQYATIPSSGTGTLGSDFYRNITQYDLLGRTQYLTQVVRGSASSNRVEQVTKIDYDVRDRVTQVSTGVSGDTAANSHDMTDNYNAYPTLVAVSKAEYDAGGVGDDYLTKAKKYFGTGTNDCTGANFKWTYRGHLRGVEPFYLSGSTETPMGPYPVADVDWFGRATSSALYDTDPNWSTVLTGDGYSAYASSTSGQRRTQRDVLYDNLGRVYQTKRYEISSSSGTGSNYLSAKRYYDRNDNLVATGNDYAAGKEMAYDGAGRQYQVRTVVALPSPPYSSGAFNYTAPVPKPSLGSMSGGDAGVLAVLHSVFDTSGNITETDEFEANHDDLTGGSPGIDLSNNDDYVRRTVFGWYDAVGRVTTTADYGSGDTASGAGQWKYAALPTRPSSAPTASSSTALVTLYGYNADSGLSESATDPAGTINKAFYDRLGRVTYVAENFSDFNASSESGTGDSSDKSKDRVTKKIYDGPRRLKQLVAMDPNADGSLSDNQVTTYLYENTVSAARNTSQIYPDSSDTTSSGTDQLKFAYNVDGSLSQRTDQRGTILAYAYGNNRLLANQSATTLGTGVDGTIQSIVYAYDNLNRRQNVTSYSGTAGSGTLVNDVQFAYNDLSQITTTYQSYSGAVNTSTTPKVQYTYDATATSSVFSAQHRQQTTVYPSGRTVYYDYGTSGAAYDRLSQVRTIYDTNSSGTALATYDYNGAGSRTALATLPQPSLKLDKFLGTSGTYAGRDRFGRTVDQYWKGFGSTSDADRVHYGYDYVSSRTYRDIDSAIYATNDQDQAFTYDGLHRLGTLQQGTLSGTTISGTPTNEEDWSLDGLGNWLGYLLKAAGTTTLIQSRTSNAANEISGVSASTGSTWTTPAYDAAGNMTTVPQPATLTSGYTATYDAWNRLVKLQDGSNLVAQYRYDGRGYRQIVLSYTGGAFAEARYAYSTDDWRVVEERVGTSTSPDRQFVWGDRYIDELILRDRDTDANGSLDERLYAIQDSNWNVTAVVDATGAIQERYLYSAYGTPAIMDASFGSRSSSSYSWETLYAGYRYDSATGLHAVRNRYLHPALGTWINRDPIGYDVVGNLLEYAGSRPVSAVDPLGTDWLVPSDYISLDAWSYGFQDYGRYFNPWGDAPRPTVWDQRMQLGQQGAVITAGAAGTAIVVVTAAPAVVAALPSGTQLTAAAMTTAANPTAQVIGTGVVGGIIANPDDPIGGGLTGGLLATPGSGLRLPRPGLNPMQMGIVPSGGGANYQPSSGIPRINGRLPINCKFAGKTHPSGIEFNTQGFPNFGPVSKAQVQIQGLTGNYAKDAAMANQAVGLTKTPPGYVWHHVEDGVTMQLVPQNIHNATRHTGGAAIIRCGGPDR